MDAAGPALLIHNHLKRESFLLLMGGMPKKTNERARFRVPSAIFFESVCSRESPPGAGIMEAGVGK